MSTPQEYVEFLMSYRLPSNLKYELKMVLQNHFQEEPGSGSGASWIASISIIPTRLLFRGFCVPWNATGKTVDSMEVRQSSKKAGCNTPLAFSFIYR